MEKVFLLLQMAAVQQASSKTAKSTASLPKQTQIMALKSFNTTSES